MNSKYTNAACLECKWSIVVKSQSANDFCLTPPGAIFKHFCNKIPKACPKCGSELKTKDANFFEYFSIFESVKRIINGKRQLLELFKNRPK